jgi:hypothetical protein
MTEEQMIKARTVHLMDQETTGPVGWYWLSFCDNKRPEGEQFLGAAMVRAHGVLTASHVAWALGCNPGGEMACVGPFDNDPPEGFANRLLTRAEVDALNAIVDATGWTP